MPDCCNLRVKYKKSNVEKQLAYIGRHRLNSIQAIWVDLISCQKPTARSRYSILNCMPTEIKNIVCLFLGVELFQTQ